MSDLTPCTTHVSPQVSETHVLMKFIIVATIVMIAMVMGFIMEQVLAREELLPAQVRVVKVERSKSKSHFYHTIYIQHEVGGPVEYGERFKEEDCPHVITHEFLPVIVQHRAYWFMPDHYRLSGLQTFCRH